MDKSWPLFNKSTIQLKHSHILYYYALLVGIPGAPEIKSTPRIGFFNDLVRKLNESYGHSDCTCQEI